MSVIEPDLAFEVTKTALETGGTYSDIVCQRRLVTSVRFEDGKVDDVSTGTDSGAGVRVIKGDLAAFAHTDIVDRDHLMRAARTAAEALVHAAGGEELRVEVPSRKAPPAVCEPDEGAMSASFIAEKLAQCDDAGRSAGKDVRQVTAVHNSSVEDELIANSLGEMRESTCRRTRLIVQVVASRDGVIQTGAEAPGELAGPAYYSRHDHGEIAAQGDARGDVFSDERDAVDLKGDAELDDVQQRIHVLR